MTITHAQLVEAIRAAAVRDPGDPRAVTTGELVTLTGIEYKRLLRIVRAALDQGAIRLVKVRRPGVDGRQSQVPAWLPADA